jgi:hypothetical protein
LDDLAYCDFVFSMVVQGAAFGTVGLKWFAILLGIFWLIYLVGLWFKQTHFTDTTGTLFLGYAIGCKRMIPNQLEYTHWLRVIPKGIAEVLALAFILIFVSVLPLIAEKVIKTQKRK